MFKYILESRLLLSNRMKKLSKYFQTRSLREIKFNLCLVTQIFKRERFFNKRHGRSFTTVRKCLRLNIISGLFVEQSMLSATFHRKLDILERFSLLKCCKWKKKLYYVFYQFLYIVNFYIRRDFSFSSTSK